MTAGTGNQTGISHIEQTPDGVKDLHAVQLWMALPTDQAIAPNFEHYPELPTWSCDGVNYILTTGSYHGHTALTTQYSPLVGVDMQFTQKVAIGTKKTAMINPLPFFYVVQPKPNIALQDLATNMMPNYSLTTSSACRPLSPSVTANSTD